jgi:hypothetical protein
MKTANPYVLVYAVVSTKEDETAVTIKHDLCHSEETAKVRFAELALEHGGEVYLFRSEPVPTLVEHQPRVTFGAVKGHVETFKKRKRRTKAELESARSATVSIGVSGAAKETK